MVSKGEIMAYVKYKELTKYFNFNKEIEIKELPKYVLDYVNDNEKIYKAYKTKRDKAVFTDKRMILFDVSVLSTVKKYILFHINLYQLLLFLLNQLSLVYLFHLIVVIK